MKIRLKGKNLRPLLKVVLFNPCIYFIAETVGISCTTASESGIFLASIPAFTLGTSALFFKKKPSVLQLTGILITFAGAAATVFAAGATASLSSTGYMFLLAAVISYALYCVFVDKATEFTDAEITYAMLLSGAGLFTLLAVTESLLHGTFLQLAALPFRSVSFLAAILYQGIGCSVAAFFLSNAAIAKIGVNRTSSFIGVSTVVSIAAGALLLHKTFTAYQLFGTVAILIGIYTANAGKLPEQKHGKAE